MTAAISTDSVPAAPMPPIAANRGPTSAWLIAGRALLGNPTSRQLHALQRLIRDWAVTLSADLACVPSSGPGPLPGTAAAPCNIAIGVRVALARRNTGPSEGLIAMELRAKLRQGGALPEALWLDIAEYTAGWSRSISVTAQTTGLLLAGCGQRAESRVIYGYPRRGDEPRGIEVASVAYNGINLQSVDVSPIAHAHRRVDVGHDAAYYVIAR